MNELELTIKELNELLDTELLRTVWGNNGLAWQSYSGRWLCTTGGHSGFTSDLLFANHNPTRATDPNAPGPDHSMCARLVEFDTDDDEITYMLRMGGIDAETQREHNALAVAGLRVVPDDRCEAADARARLLDRVIGGAR